MSDLEFQPDCCATFVTPEVAKQLGVKEGGSVTRYMSVASSSERGQNFLLAYNDATDGKYLGDFCEEDGRVVGIEYLHVPPEEFDAFRRQASLAGVTMRQATPEAARRRAGREDDEP